MSIGKFDFRWCNRETAANENKNQRLRRKILERQWNRSSFIPNRFGFYHWAIQKHFYILRILCWKRSLRVWSFRWFRWNSAGANHGAFPLAIYSVTRLNTVDIKLISRRERLVVQRDVIFYAVKHIYELPIRFVAENMQSSTPLLSLNFHRDDISMRSCNHFKMADGRRANLSIHSNHVKQYSTAQFNVRLSLSDERAAAIHQQRSLKRNFQLKQLSFLSFSLTQAQPWKLETLNSEEW